MSTEALAAISRLDDGTALPGDALIADAFDRHSSDRWARMDVQIDRWAADRCVICAKPGEGPECAGCTADWDGQMKRWGDL